jgi:hypothetical protein
MDWRKIKGYSNYLLNENGDLYNVKLDSFQKGYTNSSGVRYVSLSKNGQGKCVPLAELVLNVFKPSRTVIKTYAWHEDLELINCSNDNLLRCNRADRLRMFNEIKKKKRGVYSWNIGKNNFRVVLKDKHGKTKTIGYYRTEFFARFMYIKAYQKEFGRPPY